MQNPFTLNYARALDRADSLAPLRGRFYTVPGRIYMDGNSLGTLDPACGEALWSQRGVRAWTGDSVTEFPQYALVLKVE